MPTRTRIIAHLKDLCEHGAPGDALPSVRELAQEFGASPVTITKVLSELSTEGFIEAKPGHGTFIRPRHAIFQELNYDWQSLVLGAPPPETMNNLVMSAPPGCLNLASGYMDDSVLPEKALLRASSRALRSPNAWQKAPTLGLPSLQKWFADRASPGFPPDNVLIVQGGQAALGIAIRAVVPPGATLLLESPTYLGPLVIARAAGIKLAPVAVDEYGMRPDHLEEALRRSRAHAIYLQPNFSNPTGRSLTVERREAIVGLARRFNCFIIEDDYARDLSYSGQVPPALFGSDDGHVIYVRSLTKSVAPSLRVAALCAHGPVFNRLRAALLVNDFFVPKPLQETAVEFLAHSSYGTHIKRLRSTYARRMSSLCELLARHLPQTSFHPPEGGYSLWLRLPANVDEDRLCREAERQGVLVSPGHWWFASEPIGRHLRLSIAGLHEQMLSMAVQRLAVAAETLS